MQVIHEKKNQVLLGGSVVATILTFGIGIVVLGAALTNAAFQVIAIFLGSLAGILAAMHIDSRDDTTKGKLIVAAASGMLAAGATVAVYTVFAALTGAAITYDLFLLSSIVATFLVALGVKHYDSK